MNIESDKNRDKTIEYVVYILETSDGSLYCGWTLDLERRLKEHNSSNSKTKYTRSRRPVTVVYWEEYDMKSDAMKREYQIKQLNRKEKLKLCRLFLYEKSN